MAAKKTYKSVELDPEIFEGLCRLMCNQEEIAGVFRIHRETLAKWVKKHYKKEYQEVYSQFTADGKRILRQIQWKLAETDTRMAIWLGKQHLEQFDKVEYKNVPTPTIVDDIRRIER